MTISVQNTSGSPYPTAATPPDASQQQAKASAPAPSAAPTFTQDASGFTPAGVAPVRIDSPANDAIAQQIHAAALQIAKQMMANQAAGSAGADAVTSPAVSVSPSEGAAGNTITVSQPGNPAAEPVVVQTPAVKHDDATTIANDATQIALRTPHLASTFRAFLPYASQAYNVGNEVLNEAAKYSVPLLKNIQFRNVVLDEAERVGGKDGRALAEASIKGLIKSNGSLGEAVTAAMKSFGKIRGVGNIHTQVFPTGAKAVAAAAHAEKSAAAVEHAAASGKTAAALVKEAATDTVKHAAAAKALGKEIVEKGLPAEAKGVRAFLPNVSKAFSVIGVGLSGASFLQVLKDPKSTLANKIAHGIHFAANIVGIWQPEVGLLADLAMMGVDASGKLKTPKSADEHATVVAPEKARVENASSPEEPVKVKRHPAKAASNDTGIDYTDSAQPA